MNSSPYAISRAREIFLEAVERHLPDAWPKYLDAACGEDDALRREVERLLEVHLRLSGFMVEPAAGPVETVLAQSG
jgi:hypothetical protein